MENSRHLISVAQFKELARPTSKHVEEKDIEIFIDECEQNFIIPTLGYDVFKQALINSFDGTFDATFSGNILLDGGEYQRKDTECSCNESESKTSYCVGLKKSLAYFVYAKMLRAGGAMLVRTGFVKHEENYATHIENKDNLNQYNDVMNIAENYLGSCIAYMKHHKLVTKNKKVRGTRTRIKAIGD